jgi:hypothetical protein
VADTVYGDLVESVEAGDWYQSIAQQEMFLIGGTLADRLGYKAPIMVGPLLRTFGFGLLG